MRRPKIHAILGVSNAVGLSSALADGVPLDDLIQPVRQVERLEVLPSGPTPSDAAKLTSGPAMLKLLGELASTYDIVLIDTPPVLAVSDALALSGMVDSVVLIAHAGRTSRRQLDRAMVMLDQVRAPVVGTVLNFAGRETASYSSRSYYAGSEADLPAGRWSSSSGTGTNGGRARPVRGPAPESN